MLCPNKVPTSELPVLATKVSSVPPHRAIIRHEAPAKKDLEVLLHFGKRTPAWTLSLLEWVLNCLRSSYVNRKEATKVGEVCETWKENSIFASALLAKVLFPFKSAQFLFCFTKLVLKQFKICSSKLSVHAGVFVLNLNNTFKSFPGRNLV